MSDSKLYSGQIMDGSIGYSKTTDLPLLLDSSTVSHTSSNGVGDIQLNIMSIHETDTYIDGVISALNKPAVTYSGDEGPYYVGGTYLFIINNWNGVAPVVSVSSGTVTVSGKYIYWTLGSDSSQLITVNGSASTINVLNDTRPRPNVDSVYKKFQIVGDGSVGRKITTGFDHVNDKVWTFIKSLNDNGSSNYLGWCGSTFLPNVYTDTLTGFPKNHTWDNAGTSTVWYPYRQSTNNDQKIVSKYFTDGFEYNASGTARLSNTLSDDYMVEVYKESDFFMKSFVYVGNGLANRTILHDLKCRPGYIIIMEYDTGLNHTSWFNGYGNNILQTLPASTANTLTFTNTSGNTRISTVSEKSIVLGTDTSCNVVNKKYLVLLFANDTSATSVIKSGTYQYNSSVDTTINLGFEPSFVRHMFSTTDLGNIRTYYSNLVLGGTSYTNDCIYDSLLVPGRKFGLRNSVVYNTAYMVQKIIINANGFVAKTVPAPYGSQLCNYLAIRKGV